MVSMILQLHVEKIYFICWKACIVISRDIVSSIQFEEIYHAQLHFRHLYWRNYKIHPKVHPWPLTDTTVRIQKSPRA